MKIFTFLMAVLVLVLSVMPCADTDAMGKGNAATIVKAPHQQGQEHDDACPPFCQCSCCAGFSINHTASAFSYFVLPTSTQTSAFLPSDVLELALPIWQPPKLRS